MARKGSQDLTASHKKGKLEIDGNDADFDETKLLSPFLSIVSYDVFVQFALLNFTYEYSKCYLLELYGGLRSGYYQPY